MTTDVNTAPREILISLKGINTEITDAIIRARPFNSIEDLLAIPGIGQKMLERLKEQGLVVDRAHELSEPLSEAIPSTDVPSTEPSELVDIATPVVETLASREAGVLQLGDKQGIAKFINIKEPAEKTLIEFNEVFAVPLDSLYESMYPVEQAIGQWSCDQEESQRYMIDFRPKRWYRAFKRVSDEIEFADKDLSRARDRLQEAERKADPTQDEGGYAEWEAELQDRREAHLRAITLLNGLRDRKEMILREVRTNGYQIEEEEERVREEILKQGYKFQILGGTPQVAKYQPAKIEPDMNFADDNDWQRVVDSFRDHLKSFSGMLDADWELFDTELNTLTQFDASELLIRERQRVLTDIEAQEQLLKPLELEITSIKDDKDALNQEIRRIEDCIEQDEQQISKLEDEKATWEADIETLRPHKKDEDFWGLQRREIIFMNWRHMPIVKRRDIPTVRTVNLGHVKKSNITSAILECQTSVDRLSTRIDSISSSIDNGRSKIEDINTQIAEHDKDIATVETNMKKIGWEIGLHRRRIQDLEANGLPRERAKFIAYWNNVENVASMETTVVYPDVDPLADFLASIEDKDADRPVPVQTHFFELSSNGYYTREGRSPGYVVESSRRLGKRGKVVAVLPTSDGNGHPSEEVLLAAVNPRLRGKGSDLPVIKFVESYVIEVVWAGYALGELSHSFNLLPGETKELVIEKRTKLATKVSEATKREEVRAQKLMSSFEDNLEATFSLAEKSSRSREDKAKSTVTSSDLTSASLDAQVSASADFGFGPVGGGSVSASGSWAKKRDSALTTSREAENQVASNQSKDTLKKNVANTIKKIGSETSANNKLEISSATSEEREESVSEKEIVRFENPNIGRTVNYNFFQIQNLYETCARLTDVKLVIDSGVEVFDGSGVNDIRVYELEEFGKIFANSDPNDPRSVILATIVARQIMKHYGDFLPGITTGNGALAISGHHPPNKEKFEILNLSHQPTSDEDSEVDLTAKLRNALTYLKMVPFVFRETQFIDKSTVAVNAAAYYLEAEVGMAPATEKYLEKRRDIETERQQTIVEHLKAQTQAKVFFPQIPEGATNVTIARDSLEKGSLAPKSAEDGSE